ncbi:heme-degrading domain-containing protein [Ktedonospora formicarum]|uniref:UPF0303 protein KSX_09790 n=1 Tax=Ktedonospora formicarum TaxID=2778364 RepID=A0A8J3HT68_9CHLR|nr:heme-degrading domain-containing protein [Ktedonospora formicarum]GHO42816.1 UPF0303 protein [Ktedonospora formicarum]
MVGSNYETLLHELLQQENELQFISFSNETALELGLALHKAAKEKGKSVAIDITRNGQQLFHFAMEGTANDNNEWILRKNRVVNRFGHSSFYMGIYLRSQNKRMEEKYLLAESEYAAHGGAFPLFIRGVGVVGTITVSGLPQAEDHELVTTTIRTFLKRED